MDNRIHVDSFAFPLQCQQFFLDDVQRPNWKIMCRTDVWDRRGQLHIQQSIPRVIDVGRDSNFSGLQPEVLESETLREVQADGSIFIFIAVHPKEQQQPSDNK